MSGERLGNGFGDSVGFSVAINGLPFIKECAFEINENDKQILREYARKVAELAHRPIEDEKKKLWYKHNDLEKTRPLIFCDPENGWYEIIPHTTLRCTGKLARIWEFKLRKEIFWGEQICDDRVIEDRFLVPYIYDETYYGADMKIITTGDKDGAYTWEPIIKDYSDMEKLKFREITMDHNRSEKLFNLANETLGDILPVQYKGYFWWSLGMTLDAVNLRGLEDFMVDMYENPDELHQLMAFLRDDIFNRLDFLEKNNLLTLNNEGDYVGSGGFGWTNQLPSKNFDGAHVKTQDMWGFCESQETSSVSPQMFGEFIYPYQKSILEKFGLNCYGCCEPLDPRWQIIEKSPNLRRVSVSAWANVEKMAEYLGNKYIFSWKPTPSDLAVRDIDHAAIRSYIRKTVQAAKGCNLELIMKDNHTLAGNPQNIIDWAKIAREEAGV